ncbi:glutamate--tRNA ligase [Roseiterribacter gracilis]|uniref:Glutamate--tRNA ligase n=1 Tax=Roseiterribacter gracilis TaxID=2812848 RepID=A0A8S8X7D7_9PROT|nr:glutamate--tRNA ligase 1 [Rhodospirillales bacterium TMPK1]
MSVKVRFAPSPTGRLHVGNARLALVNFLFARAQNGVFQLRMDDTDTERSTLDNEQAIQRDLAWFGLKHDEFARQSDRLDRYDAAAETLRVSGRLYPAYETAEELSLKRKAQLAAGKPPRYDRAALRLTDAERAQLEASGRKPHWRFRLDDAAHEWDDIVHGPTRVAGSDLSDPVLLREDGRPLYTLSSVVDDLEFGITHVIRGEDHLTNTAAQIQLFEALGGRGSVPTFAHLSLLTDAGGGKLSKRAGALSLESMRDDDGIEPLALASLLARLGTSDPVEPRTSLRQIIEGFDISRFGRAAARFDEEDLLRINARVLHALSYDAIAPRLAALNLQGVDAAFWEAVRPNLARFDELATWWSVAQGPIAPVIEEPAFAADAATVLADEKFDADIWSRWTAALKTSTGRSGKMLFRPLRLALTGREHGPELKILLPLIGRDRALARLRGETA